MDLYRITTKMRNLEEKLIETEGDIISEEMLQDLNFVEENKEDCMREVLYKMYAEEDNIALLSSRIGGLREMLKAKEHRYDRYRKLLAFAVKYFGETQIDEFSLSLRKSTATDTSELDEKISSYDKADLVEYVRNSLEKELIPELAGSRVLNVSVSAAVSKTEVKKIIKDNGANSVEGCSLVENYNLNIR